MCKSAGSMGNVVVPAATSRPADALLQRRTHICPPRPTGSHAPSPKSTSPNVLPWRRRHMFVYPKSILALSPTSASPGAGLTASREPSKTASTQRRADRSPPHPTGTAALADTSTSPVARSKPHRTPRPTGIPAPSPNLSRQDALPRPVVNTSEIPTGTASPVPTSSPLGSQRAPRTRTYVHPSAGSRSARPTPVARRIRRNRLS
mmetsp:Transcript_40210/g.99527  ORF Transcript_40210/g.99527 Transcript_40210/m.99527 type:complete len:205 (-) Transcript_40210:72-686(-)